MASASVIKAAPQPDLVNDLIKFMDGATRKNKSNSLDIARTALSLLKTLPFVRDAVLEFFCTLFDNAVSNYVHQIESDMCMTSTSVISEQEEVTIAEIHNVLCSFVRSNSEAWAPIISMWSLELLGNLSSKYAGRAHVSLTAGLNETLQLWMSCQATRTLIDITTQCLSCLMHSNTESCINTLLDTSVAHSPHFDWVVAHVGGCFPHTVITRVLSCGLKNFSQHNTASQGAKGRKLNSVVGILGHLAGSHFADIRTALLDLFKWSLEPGGPEESAQRATTVPFLLQLASLSPTLLKALTADVLHTLNPSMLPQLASLAPSWSSYFGGSEVLEGLIVHLALGCEQGGTQILKLLVDAASPLDEGSGMTTDVTTTSREILELLLQEIYKMLHSSTQGCNIALLDSVKQEISALQPLLLSPDPLRVQTAVRLIGLLGVYSPTVLVGSTSYLLRRASTDDHLVALVKLVTGGIYSIPASSISQDEASRMCLSQALEQAIKTCASHEAAHPSPEQLWLNLVTLLRWQNSAKTSIIRGQLVSQALEVNLAEASNVLQSCQDVKLAHAIAKVLDQAVLPTDDKFPRLDVQLTLRLARATVSYFFLCIAEKDAWERTRGVHVCCGLLSRLAVYTTAARSLALRDLLEGALFNPNHAQLFGAKPNSQLATDYEVRLLKENCKQGTGVLLAQRHSSVFHAGVIGFGPRRVLPDNPLPEHTVAHHTQLLIHSVKACCSAKGQPVSLEVVTSVSLLLVELISPDVMYNGLPWPEEEFSKVTVERDLHIRRVFDNLPVTWQLISLVASYRPALCYCSVLLRALTATLLAQWGSSALQWQQGSHRDKLLDTTTRLVELLALGQLLPPPLSSLGDVIPHLKPQEVVLLLRDCVWNYLRDHVPSPALFARDKNGLMWRDSTLSPPEPQYTETLRLTLQNSIQHVGPLYSQLFPSK